MALCNFLRGWGWGHGGSAALFCPMSPPARCCRRLSPWPDGHSPIGCLSLAQPGRAPMCPQALPIPTSLPHPHGPPRHTHPQPPPPPPRLHPCAPVPSCAMPLDSPACPPAPCPWTRLPCSGSSHRRAASAGAGARTSRCNAGLVAGTPGSNGGLGNRQGRGNTCASHRGRVTATGATGPGSCRRCTVTAQQDAAQQEATGQGIRRAPLMLESTQQQGAEAGCTQQQGATRAHLRRGVEERLLLGTEGPVLSQQLGKPPPAGREWRTRSLLARAPGRWAGGRWVDGQACGLLNGWEEGLEGGPAGRFPDEPFPVHREGAAGRRMQERQLAPTLPWLTC